MAARKSCTKLTWSEAKAKVGGSNPKGGGAAGKKDKPKGGPTHDKMLAAKIITKKLNVSQGEQIANRQAAKMAKKDMERAAYLEQKRQEEKELKLMSQNILAYKLAKKQMKQIFKKTVVLSKSGSTLNGEGISGGSGGDSTNTIVECKQMQLDEILALESIYNTGEEEDDGDDDNDDDGIASTNNKFAVCESCDIETLRNIMEEGVDPDDEIAANKVVNHPAISFVIQLLITNEEFDVGDENHILCLIIKVEYPNLYPLGGGEGDGGADTSNASQLPIVDIIHCMIVDKTTIVNCNKVLESLGYISGIDETKLKTDMNEYISSMILPDPCMYDIFSNWIPTNIYNYITMK